MPRRPNNAFRELSGRALAEQCARYVGELRTPRSRTAAERRQLVDEVASLLEVVAGRIDEPRGSANVPCTSEFMIARGNGFVDTFRAQLMIWMAQLRESTLRRAADVALDDRADEWVRSLSTGSVDELGRVKGSDAALLQQLKVLQRLYDKRKPTDPGDDAA